jgi:hypothetical protein
MQRLHAAAEERWKARELADVLSLDTVFQQVCARAARREDRRLVFGERTREFDDTGSGLHG